MLEFYAKLLVFPFGEYYPISTLDIQQLYRLDAYVYRVKNSYETLVLVCQKWRRRWKLSIMWKRMLFQSRMKRKNKKAYLLRTSFHAWNSCQNSLSDGFSQILLRSFSCVCDFVARADLLLYYPQRVLNDWGCFTIAPRDEITITINLNETIFSFIIPIKNV